MDNGYNFGMYSHRAAELGAKNQRANGAAQRGEIGNGGASALGVPDLPFVWARVGGRAGARTVRAVGRGGEDWKAGPFPSSAAALSAVFDHFRALQADKIAAALLPAEVAIVRALARGEQVYTRALVELGLIDLAWSCVGSRAIATARLSLFGGYVARAVGQ